MLADAARARLDRDAEREAGSRERARSSAPRRLVASSPGARAIEMPAQDAQAQGNMTRAGEMSGETSGRGRTDDEWVAYRTSSTETARRLINPSRQPTADSSICARRELRLACEGAHLPIFEASRAATTPGPHNGCGRRGECCPAAGCRQADRGLLGHDAGGDARAALPRKTGCMWSHGQQRRGGQQRGPQRWGRRGVLRGGARRGSWQAGPAQLPSCPSQLPQQAAPAGAQQGGVVRGGTHSGAQLSLFGPHLPRRR